MTDCIRIDGRYYDTLKLAKDHPGGELWVLQCNNYDGTSLFNTSHRRPFNHEAHKDKLVQREQVSAAFVDHTPVNQDWSLFWEVCDAIKPYLKNSGFAPWHYYLKIALILAVYLGYDVFFIMYGRSFWHSLAAALAGAWIGMNIQHDANHGAVSRNPTINRCLGLTQCAIGGSALSWMTAHNVVHHVTCNDPMLDHDLDIPLLRLHGKLPWKWMYPFQQYYFFVLEALFAPFHMVHDMVMMLRGPNAKQHPLRPFWAADTFFIFTNFLRIALAFYLDPSWHTFNMLSLMYCAGGFYLAFFFLLSHNFVGVKKETVDARSGCFVRHQAETSSNVGGFWLAMANGGLNYQIEHHLFPRVSHWYYPIIAPIVRSICRKHNIQYVHFDTVYENARSTFDHLAELGSKKHA